jgi:hypothetical protein
VISSENVTNVLQGNVAEGTNAPFKIEIPSLIKSIQKKNFPAI